MEKLVPKFTRANFIIIFVTYFKETDVVSWCPGENLPYIIPINFFERTQYTCYVKS